MFWLGLVVGLLVGFVVVCVVSAIEMDKAFLDNFGYDWNDFDDSDYQ